MELFDYKIVQTFKDRYKTEIPIFKNIPADCDVLYNGEYGLIAVPRTVDAIAQLTVKAVWCVTDPNDHPQHSFYRYNSNLYIYVTPHRKLYAWSVDMKTGLGRFVSQYSNKHLGLSEQHIRNVWPVKQVFDAIEEEIIKSPKKAYCYSMTIIQGAWPKGESIINSDPKFKNKYQQFLNKTGERIEFLDVHAEHYFLGPWVTKQYWRLKYLVRNLFRI